MNYKSVISSLLAIILFFSSLSFSVILASPLKELQDKQESIEEEKNKLTSEVKKKELELNSNNSIINSTLDELLTLDNTLTTTNIAIGQTESGFLQIAEEIELLHNSITLLEKNVGERDSVLRNRIRAIQVYDGSTDFLDVLLGSSSLLDFFERVSAINTLLEADRKIIKQQSSDIEQLELEKILVAKNLLKQRDNRHSLKELHALLESQRNEKDDLVRDLEFAQNILNGEKKELEDSYDDAVRKSGEIEQDIIALQKRQITVSNSYETSLIYTSPAICSVDGTINNSLYFAKFNSAGAFTGKGQAFIDIANEYRVDPVLMAAIAFHETGSGTSNAIMNYNNPGGLMNPETNWSTLLRFDTLEDGLRSTGRTLDKLIHKGGLTSISALGSVYAPIRAANDPTGLNTHWAPNVTKFTNEFGGLTMNCSQ